MLSLPRQRFPVTCRIGHCCVCSPLALLFASDILCNLRFANSKQRMNKISPKPCHKKCGSSANLRVCKSAGLQVCKSAVCVCRTPIRVRLSLLWQLCEDYYLAVDERGWVGYEELTVSVKCRLRTADCGPGVKSRLCVKCRLQTKSETQVGVKRRPSINCSRGRV